MASKSPDRHDAASTLTQSELRAACERLVRITQSPPERDYCHPFGVGHVALQRNHRRPGHRCLSQSEVHSKLSAIERLTEQTITTLLADGWDRLSPAQLLAVGEALCLLEAGELSQPLGSQAPAWCRLDEHLFRLAFTAWIKGPNFAVAPRPGALARRISVDQIGYRKAMQELHAAIALPSTPSARWPPRIDLWLGDPPMDEVGPPMARLWVSVRTLKFTEADAAKTGLLPANTPDQERQAREELCRRWSLREEEVNFSETEPATYQYTICCRCSKVLAV